MDDPARLMRFVLELRQAGVTDARALAAMERTSRPDFAPDHLAGVAMDDVPLPLAHAQNMTKPSVIGAMLMALAPSANDKVLEVGTGSGYQAAALASMAHTVISLERWRDLAADARAHIGAARLMRVYVHAADGLQGWVDEAPYDRIILNGAVADIPGALIEQLKPDGVILAPVGEGQAQRLIRWRNGNREDLGPVRFQALEPGVEEG